ncbi:MAG: hypothetical protein DMD59_09045 [Gemmatimonadetes bacterium]|nr:MAG: hypothetical protein DMD59_09045 [Gemmatimonadota bacterium]
MAGSKSRVWLIVGMIVTLAAAGSWAGYRWLQGAVAGLMVEGRKRYEEGTRLGSSLTATGCLDTAFARHARAPTASMSGQINEGVFLEACLRVSTPSGVCDSIPPTDNLKEIMRFSVWSVQQCRARGLEDRSCPRLLQAVANDCRRRKAGGG